jgi:selenocysteine-specific elongation factor
MQLNHLVIGTAGHIDHGKTTLIKALTHIETDRLEEEKKRGISIELGFAHIKLPSGRLAGIVDVPGHERFIKNMLAGATGMDMVMLVVAADEGVMPQTVEHLQILSLLNVSHGLVALTKIDMVDEETTELARLEVGEVLEGTFLEGCPILPVSGITGEGVDKLLIEIDRVADLVTPRDLKAPPVMPVDRVFSIQGFGTVATGTLAMGTFKCDDKVDIVPAGLTGRIRGLQVHGVDTETAFAGQRVAVNLAGLKKEVLNRGDLMCAPGFVVPTTTIDVNLTVLKDVSKPVKSLERLRIYVGAKEVLGRVAIIGQRNIGPGETGFARLRLEEPVGVLAGDPFVVRTYSPMATIGGGLILDANPVHRKLSNPQLVNYLKVLSAKDMEQVIEIITDESGKGIQTYNELRRNFGRRKGFKDTLSKALTYSKVEEINASGVKYYVSTAYLNKSCKKLNDTLERFHRDNPLKPGMSQEELQNAVQVDAVLFNHVMAKLLNNKKIKQDQQYVSIVGFSVKLSNREKQLLKKILDKLKETGFTPASSQELEQAAGLSRNDFKNIINTAVLSGEVAKIQEGFYFSSESYSSIKEKLIELIDEKGSITVAEFRDMLGTSRKFALLILEHFDNVKLTKRVGDMRVKR